MSSKRKKRKSQNKVKKRQRGDPPSGDPPSVWNSMSDEVEQSVQIVPDMNRPERQARVDALMNLIVKFVDASPIYETKLDGNFDISPFFLTANAGTMPAYYTYKKAEVKPIPEKLTKRTTTFTYNRDWFEQNDLKWSTERSAHEQYHTLLLAQDVRAPNQTELITLFSKWMYDKLTKQLATDTTRKSNPVPSEERFPLIHGSITTRWETVRKSITGMTESHSLWLTFVNREDNLRRAQSDLQGLTQDFLRTYDIPNDNFLIDIHFNGLLWHFVRLAPFSSNLSAMLDIHSAHQRIHRGPSGFRRQIGLNDNDLKTRFFRINPYQSERKVAKSEKAKAAASEHVDYIQFHRLKGLVDTGYSAHTDIYEKFIPEDKESAYNRAIACYLLLGCRRTELNRNKYQFVRLSDLGTECRKLEVYIATTLHLQLVIQFGVAKDSLRTKPPSQKSVVFDIHKYIADRDNSSSDPISSDDEKVEFSDDDVVAVNDEKASNIDEHPLPADKFELIQRWVVHAIQTILGLGIIDKVQPLSATEQQYLIKDYRMRRPVVKFLSCDINIAPGQVATGASALLLMIKDHRQWIKHNGGYNRVAANDGIRRRVKKIHPKIAESRRLRASMTKSKLGLGVSFYRQCYGELATELLKPHSRFIAPVIRQHILGHIGENTQTNYHKVRVLYTGILHLIPDHVIDNMRKNGMTNKEVDKLEKKLSWSEFIPAAVKQNTTFRMRFKELLDKVGDTDICANIDVEQVQVWADVSFRTYTNANILRYMAKIMRGKCPHLRMIRWGDVVLTLNRRDHLKNDKAKIIKLAVSEVKELIKLNIDPTASLIRSLGYGSDIATDISFIVHLSAIEEYLPVTPHKPDSFLDKHLARWLLPYYKRYRYELAVNLTGLMTRIRNIPTKTSNLSKRFTDIIALASDLMARQYPLLSSPNIN